MLCPLNLGCKLLGNLKQRVIFQVKKNMTSIVKLNVQLVLFIVFSYGAFSLTNPSKNGHEIKCLFAKLNGPCRISQNDPFYVTFFLLFLFEPFPNNCFLQEWTVNMIIPEIFILIEKTMSFHLFLMFLL